MILFVHMGLTVQFYFATLKTPGLIVLLLLLLLYYSQWILPSSFMDLRYSSSDLAS